MMVRRLVGWLAGALVVGLTAAAAPVARWDFEDPAQNALWDRSGLWKFVTQGELANEPVAIRAFPSPTQAAYFGEVRAGRGSYDTGGRVEGEMRSPWLSVEPGGAVQGGDRLRVKFSFFRQVESYAGAYDQTTVHVYFLDHADRYWNPTTSVWQVSRVGVRVFYRDSSHPSSTAWQAFESDPVVVPPEAVRFQLSFGFDSVDHVENGFLGWLVDNVEIHRQAVPLKVETEALASGRVGEQYFEHLRGSGGAPPYEWSVAAGSRLPAGLALNRATGVITGVPTESGEFSITFVLRDGARATAQKTLALRIWEAQGTLTWIYGVWGDFSGWSRTGLWHDADPLGVGGGAYYAVPGAGSYDTGARTQGYLTSPELNVAPHQGKELRVAFFHARRVEHYPGGAYDKTEVQIRFHDGTRWGEWSTVWSRDSRDPSDRFVLVREDLITQVPRSALRMQVRFGFDSVDGTENGYEGWFVAAAWLAVYGGALQIVTAELPPGEVGVPYRATVEARGGEEPYAWTATGLPDGLGMDRATGRIQGTPRRAGRFSVRVTVEDRRGTVAVRELILQVGAEQVTLFSEYFDDFEDGANWLPLPGWPSLWRVVDHVWHEGQNLVASHGRVAYYGWPWGTYETGERTTGALTSRPIDLAGATHVTVSFEYWRQVESYSGEYDQTYVQIRFTGGEWKTLWYKDSRNPSEKAWTSYTSPGITVPAGATTMQIRFVFDSVDRFNNNYVGWLVDNVRVRKATSGAPLTALAVPVAEPRGAARITVLNYPNPVRDVHTTTFAVRGVEADAIVVEVYDLAGRLVYTGEAAGSELVWHTDDLAGRYLANGVYLYRVRVKVGGVWISSELQKLAILR